MREAVPHMDPARDVDSLILQIRSVFGRVNFLKRDDLNQKLSETLACSSTEAKTQEEVQNLVRGAVRRCILQDEEDGYALVALNIARIRSGGLEGTVLRVSEQQRLDGT